MAEENNKTKLSEQESVEPTSKPKKEAVPAEEPAVPAPTPPTPPQPKPKEAKETPTSTEVTEGKPVQEADKLEPATEINPAMQDLPANKASKPVPSVKASKPETAKEVSAQPETEAPVLSKAEAPAVKSNETAKLAEEKSVVEAEPSLAEVAEGKPEKVPVTETKSSFAEVAEGKPEKVPVLSKAEVPGKATKDPADQALPTDKASKPTPTATSRPAPETRPVRPVQSKVIGFKTKFLNKLTELRELANQKRAGKVEKNINKIIAFAKEHNRIDNQDVRELIGLKDGRAREYLDKLEKQGKLVQFGKNGPKVFYKPRV